VAGVGEAHHGLFSDGAGGVGQGTEDPVEAGAVAALAEVERGGGAGLGFGVSEQAKHGREGGRHHAEQVGEGAEGAAVSAAGVELGRPQVVECAEERVDREGAFALENDSRLGMVWTGQDLLDGGLDSLEPFAADGAYPGGEREGIVRA
jgi:hypothetical protein